MSGFDPRAAIRDGLAAGVGTGPRRPSIGPPQRKPTSAVAGRPVSPDDQAEVASTTRVVGGPERAEKTVRRGSARTSATPDLKDARTTTGVRRGSRRILDVGLSPAAREVLEQDRSERTRGEILVAAISAVHEELQEHFAPHQRSGPFAEATTIRRKRRADPDRRDVVISVAAAEAEVIAELAAGTTLSVAGYCDAALIAYGRHLGHAAQQPTTSP